MQDSQKVLQNHLSKVENLNSSSACFEELFGCLNLSYLKKEKRFLLIESPEQLLKNLHPIFKAYFTLLKSVIFNSDEPFYSLAIDLLLLVQENKPQLSDNLFFAFLYLVSDILSKLLPSINLPEFEKEKIKCILNNLICNSSEFPLPLQIKLFSLYVDYSFLFADRTYIFSNDASAQLANGLAQEIQRGQFILSSAASTNSISLCISMATFFSLKGELKKAFSLLCSLDVACLPKKELFLAHRRRRRVISVYYFMKITLFYIVLGSLPKDILFEAWGIYKIDRSNSILKLLLVLSRSVETLDFAAFEALVNSVDFCSFLTLFLAKDVKTLLRKTIIRKFFMEVFDESVGFCMKEKKGSICLTEKELTEISNIFGWKKERAFLLSYLEEIDDLKNGYSFEIDWIEERVILQIN